MDLIHQLRREIEATPTPGRLAEMAVDLPRAGQPRGCGFPDIRVAVTVADTNVHAASIYECE